MGVAMGAAGSGSAGSAGNGSGNGSGTVVAGNGTRVMTTMRSSGASIDVQQQVHHVVMG